MSNEIEKGEYSDKDLGQKEEEFGPIVLGLDSEGRIVLYDDIYENITGYSEEEVIEEPIWDFFPESVDNGTVEKFLLSSDRSDLPKEKIVPWKTKDGDIIPIRWKNIQLRGGNGRVQNNIAVGVNLSEYENIQDELEEKNSNIEEKDNLLDILWESIPVGIFTARERSGDIVLESANSELEDFLGYDSGELHGAFLNDVFKSETVEEVSDEVEKILKEDKGSISLNATGKKETGEEISVNIEFTSFSSGDEPEVIGIVSENKKSIQAEKEELSSELKYYRAIVDYAQVGIAVLQKGEINYLNDRVSDIFECSKDSLKELGFLNFVHPDDREEAEVLQRGDIVENVPFEIECSVVTKMGKIKYLSFRGLDITYNGDPATQLIIEDITEHKEMEDKLKNRRKELSEAYMRLRETESKLRKRKENLEKTSETRAEFIDLVSHELSSLLTPVKTRIEMLLSEETERLPQRQEDSLYKVADKISEIEGLVGDLLDLSRIEAGRVKAGEESISIPDIIRAVLDSLEDEIEQKDHEVEVIFGDGSLDIVGDQRLLDKVFRNIILNAVQYTSSEGKIKIEAKLEDGEVVVSVSDNGVGMSEEEQEKVFQKFYRGETGKKEKARGLGIGLSVTKHFIELHDGEIEVESEKGEGTTFRIYLPKE